MEASATSRNIRVNSRDSRAFFENASYELKTVAKRLGARPFLRRLKDRLEKTLPQDEEVSALRQSRSPTTANLILTQVARAYGCRKVDLLTAGGKEMRDAPSRWFWYGIVAV